jgi:hypothetical protein
MLKKFCFAIGFTITSVNAIFIFSLLITGCTPRVEVAVPDKPITINLNVKIEHEIRVRVEKDLEDLFSQKGDIF